MPRKKKPAAEVAATETGVTPDTGATTAIAEPVLAAEAQAKNWGPPYKSIFSTPTFEMGENRRYKQRVFTFKEKPAPEILAKLKENGFTYRANEQAWTITASPDTRRLTDELARELAGPDYIQGMQL